MRWRARITAVALTACLTLTACAPGSSDTTSTPATGGTVRVSVLGSATDTLDVTKASTYMPYAVALNVYDSLAILKGSEPYYQLIDTIEPNSSATSWTITIKDGVKFHDGTAMTADDVLYSLKYLGSAPNYGTMFSDVDFDASTSDGSRTVVLKLTKPRSDLVEAVLGQISVVFPKGTTDFTTLNGSGPYKLVSFDANTGAVLEPNKDYWGGAPSLDRLEFIPVADADARLSALTGGQVEYAMGITPTGAQTVENNNAISIMDPGSEQSSAFQFTMNTRIAPFNDPEVRAALKSLVDRQALVDNVFRGKGEVGNDVVGKGLSGYNSDLSQVTYDKDAAAKVFADKNVTSLNIIAAEITPGITDAAKLLATQLAEANVTLTVKEMDPSAVYSDPSAIASANLFSNYAINRPFAAHAAMFTAAGAPGNYSGWSDTKYNSLITQAQATTDTTERQNLLSQAQEVFHTSGGEVVWGFQPVLAAHVTGLSGIEIAQSIPLMHKAQYTK